MERATKRAAAAAAAAASGKRFAAAETAVADRVIIDRKETFIINVFRSLFSGWSRVDMGLDCFAKAKIVCTIV
jgi:hypothetical protein